jgi:hypothetical protein
MLVVRNTYVAAYAEKDPARAAAFWGGHPRVLVSQALTEIGVAAVRGQSPPPNALDDINRAVRLAPLMHDAFLVRGIRAQQDGHAALAEQAFVAARARAPREAAPRYFLSQLYLTSGRAREGIGELATLARLLPNGPASVAPSLAAYAQSSGDVANLKATFRSHPELEKAVLNELVKNPANAALAMRLANRTRELDGNPAEWATLLIPRLVDAGRFGEARALWARVSGAPPGGLLYDAAFRDSKAPPPFNWQLRSDSAGYAERDGRGGLHVVYYGRDDVGLASQTVLLAPGRYRLAMRVSGNPGGLLRWAVSCLPAKKELLTLSLGAAASSQPAGDFVVPEGCKGQRIELAGASGDLPKQADITISALSLSGGADVP